jgi:hypothetical protein
MRALAGCELVHDLRECRTGLLDLAADGVLFGDDRGQ